MGTEIIVNTTEMLTNLAAAKLIDLYLPDHQVTVVAHDDGCCDIESLDHLFQRRSSLSCTARCDTVAVENQEIHKLADLIIARRLRSQASTQNLDKLL